MQINIIVKRIIVFMILIGVPYFGYTQNPIPRNTEEATVFFYNYLKEENTQALDELMSSSFEMVDLQGNLMRKEIFLTIVRQGYLKISDSFLSSLRTKSYNEIEIVTGNWLVAMKFQGARLQGDVFFSIVFQKTGGFWKMVSLQLTPLQK